MPTAVISDIHGNAEALKRVLEDIEKRGLSRIVCLGDIVGYGPEPLACVDLVRQRCAWSLMGNHDFGVLYEPTNFNANAESAAFWTREQFDKEPDEALRTARYEFLGRLRVRVVETEPDGAFPILAVHGSPRRPINEYIFPDDATNAPEKIQGVFDRVERVAIVGHTHVPGVFTGKSAQYSSRDGIHCTSMCQANQPAPSGSATLSGSDHDTPSLLRRSSTVVELPWHPPTEFTDHISQSLVPRRTMLGESTVPNGASITCVGAVHSAPSLDVIT